MKRRIVIRTQCDLDTRPIANLVQLANRYASQIYLEMGDVRINVKSIMGMMSIALSNGEEIMLNVNGEDEEEAEAAIEKFFTE